VCWRGRLGVGWLKEKGRRRTLSALVVLERLEAGKGCSAGDDFMTETRLVFFKVIVVVNAIVGLF